MKAYVMDAFSRTIFGGNQAGVVLPDRELDDATMCAVAAELKHSETAFVSLLADNSVALRYFTPAGEVDLCGHATIGAFALLRRLGMVSDGTLTAHTKTAELAVTVSDGTVWMDMAPPKLLRELEKEELSELYAAYGLTADDCPEGMLPQIISTGLPDIMMPVRDRDTLMRAVQDEKAVIALSRRYECVGVHMFCIGDGCTARCSNFAPLYDIPEECATGTSNGALTYYLYRCGMIQAGEENLFVQGEHMHRASEIRSRLYTEGEHIRVQIGGSAVQSFSGELHI